MNRRLCFMLDLVDDAGLIAEYEARHAAGSGRPEVIDDIVATGFLDMEIWRTGNRCVMIAEVTDDFPRPRGAEAQAAIDRWEHEMWRYQQALPHAAPGEKWTALTRIFTLDEQRPVRG